MSQKGEKYARRMERRVDKLEQDVAAITTEQTTQGVRISAVEDDLAVYRAAVSARELKQAAAEIKAAKERRTARAAERERKARRRNKVLAFIALALFVAVCVVMVAKAYSEEPAAEPAAPEASAAPAAILPTELLFTAAAEEEYMEDPQETEKIEEALLAQGYFSLAVPMPYEWQDYMRTYCEEYGCPYPLALAVAQTESNFDMDAVGASGEVGIMQLNPGPGGSYHAEIQAATERRTARAAERERKARRRNKVLAFIALALFVAVCVVMVAKAYSEEPAAEPAAPEASAAPAAILPTELLFTAAAEEEYMEDPQETEKIEEALLAQGYFSLAVPMPYEWQDYMRTYCEEYGCPYPLALAVAQTESNFDMDAVGASGEVGIMQLNPGPGGSYHAEIQAATGLDPTTASGNIAGGCYKLGLYLAKYGNVEKATMAYNMGEGGARSAWDSGITSTDYSKAVKEAMETWECTVNAWGGV